MQAKHSGTKDFKCAQCKYAAAMKGSLNKHVKAVHEKTRDFKCDICNYTAKRKDEI
jgi:KRAB domain-containing zinc finger protein